MLNIPRIAITVCAPFAFCLAAVTDAADWPNFRGPAYDGISSETGLKTRWNEPMPLVWERTLGSAFSSFAAVGNRIYTCGTQDDQQVLFCLDADTGEIVWQVAIEKEYHDAQGGNGTRATPTVDDGRVYILGGHGRLLCCDAKTGKEIWSRQFSHKPTWGYAGSVLIEGDLAIATAGNDEGAIAAFNKKDGTPVWKCGDDTAGYSTPYPFTFNGRRYIAGFTGESAIIADAKDGREVWRTEWKTDWDVNAAAPIFHDGNLFLTSGYRTGCALFKLREEGSTLSAEPVWKSKALMNKFQSFILYDGDLYSSDQKAFKCVDFLTGEEHWSIPRIKHGTVVLAEGNLFLLTQDGQLQIGKASPQGFSPTTTADVLSGRCWTVPVLHNGRLYARNLERMVCFDLKP